MPARRQRPSMRRRGGRRVVCGADGRCGRRRHQVTADCDQDKMSAVSEPPIAWASATTAARSETDAERTSRREGQDLAAKLRRNRDQASRRQRWIVAAVLVLVLIVAGSAVAYHRHQQQMAAQRSERCLYYAMTLSQIDLDLAHPECVG